MSESTMDDFWDDTNAGQAHLKGGFLGFNGSGKTLTATFLAVAAREVLGLKGPIGFFDTETGEVYVRPIIEKLTGQKPRVKRSRGFEDLLTFGKRCVESGVSVALVDSMTHPWRELCDSYLTELNAMRIRRGWQEQKKLEFQDWNVIKPKWEKWTEFYLNAPLSIIICGRAGWEYEMSKDEETGKKELNKVGVKMKTEGEFGFEPSLLVQMEQDQRFKPGTAAPEIIRRATVLKDRYTILDGKSCEFAGEPEKKGKGKGKAQGEQAAPPVDDPKRIDKMYQAVKVFFMPFLERLQPAAAATQINTVKTEFGMSEDGRASWDDEKRQRKILCEEIEAELVAAHPGQSAADKQAKITHIKECFGTGSWTRVEGMRSGDLRAGLIKLRQRLGVTPPLDPAAWIERIVATTTLADLDVVEAELRTGGLTTEALLQIGPQAAAHRAKLKANGTSDDAPPPNLDHLGELPTGLA